MDLAENEDIMRLGLVLTMNPLRMPTPGKNMPPRPPEGSALLFSPKICTDRPPFLAASILRSLMISRYSVVCIGVTVHSCLIVAASDDAFPDGCPGPWGGFGWGPVDSVKTKLLVTWLGFILSV